MLNCCWHSFCGHPINHTNFIHEQHHPMEVMHLWIISVGFTYNAHGLENFFFIIPTCISLIYYLFSLLLNNTYSLIFKLHVVCNYESGLLFMRWPPFCYPWWCPSWESTIIIIIIIIIIFRVYIPQLMTMSSSPRCYQNINLKKIIFTQFDYRDSIPIDDDGSSIWRNSIKNYYH